MDADDISYPHRLEKQYNYFKEHPDTVMLSTSVRIVKTDLSLIENINVDNYYNCYNLNFICSQFHPTIMYKRSVILGHGGYTMTYSEDFDLWWRLMAGNNKIGHIEEILVDYRRSEKSLSTVVKKKEYDVSSHELLLRNLRFYMGPEYQLTHNEAACLQHIYEPLLKHGSVNDIVVCLKKLELINEKIYSKPNVNYTGSDLIPYAKIKREYILFYYYVRLPKLKAALLLFRTHSLSEIITRAVKPFSRKKK